MGGSTESGPVEKGEMTSVSYTHLTLPTKLEKGEMTYVTA